MNSGPHWLTKLFNKARQLADSDRKVYLVRRSQYESPMGHRIDSFAANDLTDWFIKYWASSELEALLESSPHSSGFESVFEAMKKHKRRPPHTWAQIEAFLNEIPTEGVISAREHSIEALTNDDEIDLAWYLFDETFATERPDRTTYLLQQEWDLPESWGHDGVLPTGLKCPVLLEEDDSPNGRFVYAVFLSALDGMTIEDITGSFRFDGLNLPELSGWLDNSIPAPSWPCELLLLRMLIMEGGNGSTAERLKRIAPERLNEVLTNARLLSSLRYSKAIGLNGTPEECARDWELLRRKASENQDSYWIDRHAPPRIQFSDHLCQVRFERMIAARSTPEKIISRHTTAVLLFDNQWLAAHHDLGISLLRYSSGSSILNGR